MNKQMVVTRNRRSKRINRQLPHKPNGDVIKCYPLRHYRHSDAGTGRMERLCVMGRKPGWMQSRFPSLIPSSAAPDANGDTISPSAEPKLTAIYQELGAMIGGSAYGQGLLRPTSLLKTMVSFLAFATAVFHFDKF